MSDQAVATAAPAAGWWSDYSVSPVTPILQAALSCFVESGYHGTGIRNVASAAGLSVPGLYHHYESKQAILVALMSSAMTDLYDRSEAALADASESVPDRFEKLIECLVLFHAHRAQLAFIAASEIRSLDPDGRARLIADRDRQQHLLDDIVDEGVVNGTFVAERPRDASRAIVTMCTGVAQWYHLGGSLSPEDLSREYVDFSMRLLGGPTSDGSGPAQR